MIEEKERDNIIKKIDSAQEFDLMMREMIIGFLITIYENNINVIPLTFSWDGLDDMSYNDGVRNDEKIIGIIPAQQDSYRVFGLIPDEEEIAEYPSSGIYISLGYELKGTYHPDWKEVLKKFMIDNIFQKKKTLKIKKEEK